MYQWGNLCISGGLCVSVGGSVYLWGLCVSVGGSVYQWGALCISGGLCVSVEARCSKPSVFERVTMAH